MPGLLGITIQFVWVVSGWGGQANDLDEFIVALHVIPKYESHAEIRGVDVDLKVL